MLRMRIKKFVKNLTCPRRRPVSRVGVRSVICVYFMCAWLLGLLRAAVARGVSLTSHSK